MVQDLIAAGDGLRARSPTGIYLGILSRFPTEDEVEDRRRRISSRRHIAPREAAVDLAWALINSAEFLYRH